MSRGGARGQTTLGDLNTARKEVGAWTRPKMAVAVSVLLVLVTVQCTSPSRLPLIVFQHHHHPFHRLEDMFEDDWSLPTVPPQEYHAYKTDDTDYRPLRILYQVGVSVVPQHLAHDNYKKP